MLVPSLPSDKLLWHYTSMPVLQKVIEEAQLHATNIRYMNDAGEFKDARGLLTSCIQSVRVATDSRGETWHRALWRTIWDNLLSWGGIEYPPEVYVTCFSGVANQLSQWRAYCRPGPGVAIGFDAEVLIRAIDTSEWRLVRCQYPSPLRQRQEIEEMLSGLVDARQGELYQRGVAEGPEREAVVIDIARDVWARFEEIAVRNKHMGFAEEQEYRLVASRLGGLDPRAVVKPRNGTLIPYLPLKFSTAPESMPIKRIWIGPVTDVEWRDLHLHAIHVLQFANRLEPLDIRYSETPLRDT